MKMRAIYRMYQRILHWYNICLLLCIMLIKYPCKYVSLQSTVTVCNSSTGCTTSNSMDGSSGQTDSGDAKTVSSYSCRLIGTLDSSF